MKLILSSAGFATPEIIAKAEELTRKNRRHISVAVINEGYAVEHDNNLRWVLDDLIQVRDAFGGNLELVNLLALDRSTVKRRIMKHDIVYVVGGHTDYLMTVFKKTGFAGLLPTLLKDKVYVGSSAGAMVLGCRVSTAAYRRLYGESQDFGVREYLKLVDFAIKPHLNNRLFPANRKDVLLKISQDYKGELYGLADDAAIVVHNGRTYTIGSRPLRIIDGKLVDE
ncbi:MAG TPA: Type 1 glutamine amidotransferase-like domain-containing protein [Candidatus Saccharimonadales bacterium]